MKTLVAMSGGVDSSVAAYLAKEQGDVWGVYMQLHDEAPTTCDSQRKTCCGHADALDAQSVARHLGIEFDTLDLRESFKRHVFENFISEYKAGRTPIPCMHCNSVMKFKILFNLAIKADCTHVATGHYCQKQGDYILQGEDPAKDQSYFMWAIPFAHLRALIFPVGTFTKAQTRNLAVKAGLITAQKRESQDLCFVPEGNYRTVLTEYITPKTGNIVHARTGKIIGTHEGHWNYTHGQRKGLPAIGSPLFVTEIIATTNTIYVSERTDLFTNQFNVHAINWHLQADNGFVRVRHHARPVPFKLEGNTVLVEEPVIATPGQAAVFYKDNLLLGGAIIS